MPIHTKCCSQNTQKLSQVAGSLLHFSRFLSFTRYFLFLLSLASLFLFASCDGGASVARDAGSTTDNLSIASNSVDEDDRSIDFRVSLSVTSDSATSFYYRTKDDSAIAGSDYRATSASASIPAGDTTAEIPIAIVDDQLVEDEESFFVEILRSSTADTVIARATATIKIDDLPSLSITGSSAVESAGSLQFVASLSEPFPGNDVSFDYETMPDSASADVDYISASGTVTIKADSTQIAIPISIVNDGLVEGTEVFKLKISNSVNANIAIASALGIINGEIPSLFIADNSTLEYAGSLEFIVILDKPVNQTVYFDYQTIAGSASAGSDYISASGRASIPAGSITTKISIAIIDDAIVEDDESFFVEITNIARDILISRGRATATIKIDEIPTLSIKDTFAAEGAGRLQFIARLSAPFPGNDVSFFYQTLARSASSDLDYTHIAARATIKAGELTASIFVDIIDDLDVENDESFDLVISNPINASINLATATATIKIDDLPILSIANVSAFENVGILKFVASLSVPFTGGDVSFDYQTLSGSASASFDYTSDSGRASILAGDTTTEIPIAIRDDNLVEAAESFDLVISNLVNATINQPSATATIKIDELPTLSVTDATALESAGSLQFVASLSEPFPGNDVSFDYETLSGSASRDLDYTYVAARATIKAGELITSIFIDIIDDASVEADESFDLVISNLVNATIDKNRARVTATIKIDDLPILSIANVSVSEDVGTLRFTASLSAPFLRTDVSFDYETLAGSASATFDYLSASGSTSIPAGDTTTEISITIIDDGVNEGDEIFSLKLSNPVNATISQASALGIIKGQIASLSIADGSAFESDLELRFVVTLSKPFNSELSFDYETIPSSASATFDYISASGSTSIKAGDTSTRIPITIIDDTSIEDEEIFFVKISTNAPTTDISISKESATGTIKIDDLPTLSIAGASAIESAGSVQFIARLSAPFPGNEVSFFYSTLGGSAIADLDYTHSFARASIKADSTSVSIPISIIDDVLIEADESFDLVIANPANATIDKNRARATGIIEFDDLPSLSVVGSSAIESAVSLRFTVFLSVPIVKDVSFDYETLSGSASATSDYISASGSTSILAGDTSTEIFIDLIDDALVEDDESFDLVIANPVNATIDLASATATIKIDELPILSITDATALESAQSLQFIASLSAPFPGNIVSFDYHTIQGSAIADLDYTHSFASAAIQADSTSVSISISIIDDLLVEADESFDLVITNPVNATISTARATGIIEFEDLPRLSVTGSSAIESARSLRFTAFLSVPIVKDVSFEYQTLSGSASATSDYTSASGSTSILAGDTSTEIFIDISDDSLVEADESFDLVITNPVNATIDKNRASATATIKIDDLPTLSITGSSVIESADSIKFLVTLSVPFPGNIVSFDYETIEGSAKNILDYTHSFARASIGAGDSTTTIAIVIRNDNLIEEDESFDVIIYNPINATIDKDRATATIKIDDLPSLAIANVSASEDAGTLRFTASLSAPFLRTDVSFDYETLAGSASATFDYISAFGTAGIPAGDTTTEIFITIIDDGVNEGDEIFSLSLSNPVNATISKASALGIIKGQLASLFIADATAFESDLELRFVVTLSQPFDEDLSVDYKTIAISASDELDYTGVVAKTITLVKGDTTAEIIIDISDDTSIENDETFFVVISPSVPSTEVSISRERAKGTIKNDDLPILSIANVTTLENAGSLEFVAFLSAPFLDHIVSFDYETLSGSASEGLDYSYLLTTANIYSGDTTVFININILDDDLIEDDETFDLVISNLVNATISKPRATATIKIDELPSLSITDATAFESDRSIQFIVRLSVPFLRADVSFDYKTIAGSASADSDYTSASSTASILAGDTTTAIFIDLSDDSFVEDDETFDLVIANPANATIDKNRASATATIKIDDLPSLYIIDATALEGAGSVKFIATLSPPFRSTDVSFFYSTIASSASDELDYTGVAFDTATISAGDSTTAILIAIIDDDLIEDDETFDLVISNLANATIDKPNATATIKIDELPSLSITDATAFESDRSIQFIVRLSVPFLRTDVSFDYKTIAGSASADSDYTSVFSTASILAGDTTTAIFIDLSDDSFVEDDETFDLVIANPVNATIDKNRASATATIKIDDLPSLSITDATALEDAGTLQFIVYLSVVFPGNIVSFDYQTIPGSASADSDYTSASGTVSILAGDTTAGIEITIIDDKSIENNETFELMIAKPTNATIGKASATGTIKIDEVPSLSVTDNSVLEDAGVLEFVVTSSAPFPGNMLFDYQTIPGSASATLDYISASGSTRILEGDTTVGIEITIIDDKSIENNESFELMIINPTNATISQPSATGTIKIDEVPSLSVADATALEGAGVLDFVVTSSALFPVNIFFDYSIIAGSASATSDYTASAKGTGIIRNTQTATIIEIIILDDGVNEGDEIFSLSLSNPINATISKASALGIIEGEIPSLFIADGSAVESSESLKFVVTLSKPVNQNISFSYQTIAGSASDDIDYIGVVAKEVTIAANDTTAEIVIELVDDTRVEDDEDFFVVISTSALSTEVAISKELARGSIKVDDLPSLSIVGSSVAEDAGTLQFIASLSSPFPGNIVSFDYHTMHGSASATFDYLSASDRVSILAGDTTTEIFISIIDDASVEADESFDVIVSNPLNATISTQRATGIIKVDDKPSLSITDAIAFEGAGTLQFIASLSVPFPEHIVSFDYETLSGSASATFDYFSASGRASILAGDTTTAISIAIFDDLFVEEDESFDVIIANPFNASIGKASATATIKIDELPSLSIADATALENANTIEFSVTLSKAFLRTDVFFSYQTIAGSASATFDYIHKSQSAIISAGETSITISIDLTTDEIIEGDETFEVKISEPINASISKASALGIIKGELPSLFIADATAIESAKRLQFIATLSQAVDKSISFNYQTLPGSASATFDYLHKLGKITIPTGDTTAFITIELIDDASVEDNETFFVEITTVTQDNDIIISKGRAIGIIKIDDYPILSVADSSSLEDAGLLTFTILLSEPFVGHTVSFYHQTIDGSANKDLDYLDSFRTTTINAGDTSIAIAITIIDDLKVEADESFDLVISSPINATISRKRATATIKIDDLPNLSIADVNVLENARFVTFSASLSSPFPGNIVSFDYHTMHGSASATFDYLHKAGRATILAGDTTAEISIAIIDDSATEDDESFELVISNLINATINKPSATATISIDELPSLSITDAAALESTRNIQFIATLNPPFFSTDVFFVYQTIDGSAKAGTDYIYAFTGATIIAGDTTTAIDITLIDDFLIEDTKNFELVISNPIDATISRARATATIKIDDLNLSIADATTLEKDATSLQFVVTLSAPFLSKNVSFDYQTIEGSASANLDYIHQSGSVIISAGDTTAEIIIALLDDELVEGVETFFVEISNLMPDIPIVKSPATGTIELDELPILTIADSSAAENAGVLTFTARLSAPFTAGDVVFDYQTQKGSANNTILWQQATADAGWSARQRHTSLVFDNKMWVLGGRSNGASKNDVWDSTNGVVWREVKANDGNGWKARSGHSSLVFEGKMWVLGGSTGSTGSVGETSEFSDVWSSTNGVVWRKVKAHNPDSDNTNTWLQRGDHTSVVFDNKMWLLGFQFIKDAWYSTDGATWTRATDPIWDSRISHTSVVFDNKMWVLGGIDNLFKNKNDVWDSTNGVTWTDREATNHWSERFSHTSVVFDGKMWVLGGNKFITGTEQVANNNVWFSSNGADWTELAVSSSWSARNEHTSVVFEGKIWVLGGKTGRGDSNDVHFLSFRDDYQSVSDKVVIHQGEQSASIDIVLFDNNTLDTVDQTFDVIIANPLNAIIDTAAGGNRARGTILLDSWLFATNAAWSARQKHSSLVFDDKIWVLGGEVADKSSPTDASIKNDVWDATNGINWRESASETSWDARKAHSSLVFDGRIWVLGGNSDSGLKNDVWDATNGINWREVKADNNDYWDARQAHSSLVFDNKMWVLGGNSDSGLKNDVWDATNGINWSEVKADNNDYWSARQAHSSLVFDNKMWVLGGNSDSGLKNDVWYSSNGVVWSEATAGANWEARQAHSSLVFDDKMWVLGGDSQSELKNDMWYATDGINWIKLNTHTNWDARKYHTSLVFKHKIWVLGGIDESYKNDLWFLTR